MIRNMLRYVSRRKSIKSLAVLGIGFPLLIGSSLALAHHSFAMFDQVKELTLKGTVVSFAWGNPHVYLRLESKGQAGPAIQYLFEGGSVNMLSRYGWKPSSVKFGDTVTVIYHPLRNGDPGGALKSVQTPTGQVLKTW
ncbi:MAG: DUF6152 family protein [Sphingobium sp.]